MSDFVTPEGRPRITLRAQRCRHCKTPLIPKTTPDGIPYNACGCRCCVTWLDVEDTPDAR